ncbi:hypothetical protein CSKR_106078 [Clonorchis sinensis]|uniref:Uncharacterized protein n=1 Tax=Clonorchis sinensis TaxID=79923 RepID=A0A419QE54_CLOSI|nr:hypothetical protein CSKR_106078 [Clonorchis sinensis]
MRAKLESSASLWCGLTGIITPEQKDDRSNESGVNMNKIPIPQNAKCNMLWVLKLRRQNKGYSRILVPYICAGCFQLGARWYKWLESEFVDRNFRGSNPTYASRLSLTRLGQPGSIPALELPSDGMVASTGAVLQLNSFYWHQHDEIPTKSAPRAKSPRIITLKTTEFCRTDKALDCQLAFHMCMLGCTHWHVHTKEIVRSSRFP